MKNKFDDIRAYTTDEFPDVMQRLSNEKTFIKLLSTLFPLMPKEQLKQRLLSFKNTDMMQQEMIFPFLKYLETECTKGVSMIGAKHLHSDKTYLFISNHRDIVLDSALLCLNMIENNLPTVDIAVGDNLLIFPWIEDLVRANKSCVVQRSLTPRETLKSSIRLSEYIRYVLHEKQNSMWIAQREGRAKDSDDRTQVSLLKMLALAGKNGNLIDDLKELNICPLTISYEYDPCDYLKAKEFQQKRDNPKHKKTPQDDLINMQTGVMGYKGKVVYHVTGAINDELDAITYRTNNKKEQLQLVTDLIDKKIHLHYNITNVNKIAFDALFKTTKFANEYEQNEQTDFLAYVKKQVEKVDLQQRDDEFLTSKILEMYANPLKNQLIALDV